MAEFKPKLNFMDVTLAEKGAAIRPEFMNKRQSDLIVKGGKFYAVWDSDNSIWSTDIYECIDIIDADLFDASNSYAGNPRPLLLSLDSTKMYKEFLEYMKRQPDSSAVLDRDITFLSDKVVKSDYRSKRLPYDMADIPTPAFDKFMTTVWTSGDIDKIEWCIGSIIEGDAKNLEKFLVLYGAPGTGKSTMINIVNKIFEGYSKKIDMNEITGGGAFATASIKDNPLVGYDEDTDVSKIKDDGLINTITSHQRTQIKEKYVAVYNQKVDTFIILGTNSPVKVNSTNSGIIRRMIDANPTGNKIPPREFKKLEKEFLGAEIPGIAYKCHQKYLEFGPNAYDSYRSEYMLRNTNAIYDFIIDIVTDGSPEINSIDCVPLTTLYNEYTKWCEETGAYKLSRQKFRLEIEPYWDHVEDRMRVKGKSAPQSNVFCNFLYDKIGVINEKYKPMIVPKENEESPSLFTCTTSLLDELYKDCPAQYSTGERPERKWDNVTTTLKDIDTSREHYILPPDPTHIVIDFDFRDADGNKNPEINMQHAAKWPATYGEFSKSGGGVHLHYIYDGNPEYLASRIDEGTEVKVYKGKGCLRRRLTYCNDKPVAHLPAGFELLPTKTVKKGDVTNLVDMSDVERNKWLRRFITRCIRKEHHGATTPEVYFIKAKLDEAYASGLPYDVMDMYEDVLLFCSSSTNQQELCVRLFSEMHFKSETDCEALEAEDDDPLIFFDIEIYPNLFLICWKKENDDNVVRMINPSADEVRHLLRRKLVGFNNRGYDNHVLYAAGELEYDMDALYDLSQRLVNKDKTISWNAKFGPAWNIGYADAYDIASKKQSLKKWEIDLKIYHKEMDIPWNEPVPDDKLDEVCGYCDNDVVALEEVWHSKKFQQDIVARQILCELSGKPMITGQQTLVKNIIFEGLPDKDIKKHLVYTDLSEEFPGYEFKSEDILDAKGNKKGCKMVSTYKGHVLGEGGLVEFEPGYYEDVVCYDVASEHPHSLIRLNLFGKYTKNFEDIVKTRICIKHKDYDGAKELFGGKLAPYLGDESQSKALAQALKMVINPVYGYTAQKSSPFYDPRNVDNIVAKRGSLFMVEVKEAVEAAGYQVVHIKTDSIKVAHPDQACEDLIMSIGHKYGYDFEVEDRFDKFCLVNKACYIARTDDGEWHGKATMMIEPYVLKTLFTKEPLTFDDLCQTKEVKRATPMYLNFNESGEDNYVHVGHVGLFTPVRAGQNGGLLLKQVTVGDTVKFDAVTGTKGYRWVESCTLNGDMSQVDYTFYEELARAAREEVEKYVPYEEFIK